MMDLQSQQDQFPFFDTQIQCWPPFSTMRDTFGNSKYWKILVMIHFSKEILKKLSSWGWTNVYISCYKQYRCYFIQYWKYKLEVFDDAFSCTTNMLDGDFSYSVIRNLLNYLRKTNPIPFLNSTMHLKCCSTALRP